MFNPNYRPMEQDGRVKCDTGHGWAIIGPHGWDKDADYIILESTFSTSRKTAITKYMEVWTRKTWKQMYRKGARAVRVTLEAWPHYLPKKRGE
jgi:hypothetical protein